MTEKEEHKEHGEEHKLFSVKQWESAKPSNIDFFELKLREKPSKVVRALGVVYSPKKREVWWNEDGKCHAGKKRVKEFDLLLR
jgi:hypothetical protein